MVFSNESNEYERNLPLFVVLLDFLTAFEPQVNNFFKIILKFETKSAIKNTSCNLNVAHYLITNKNLQRKRALEFLIYRTEKLCF